MLFSCLLQLNERKRPRSANIFGELPKGEKMPITVATNMKKSLE